MSDLKFAQDTVRLRNCQILRDNLSTLGSELHCSVDVGMETYCTAHVPDTSRIFIETVHGFFVEMTLSEAKNYLDAKLKLLQERVQ
ncbi:MAG: hypothetical protein KVP17_003830 [Porospora cf. gigantea B]|uniref:uncharacterized protein n=1 Tax=Porospora cf. gigantea B TaxID=2853592 RepID=UPI003571E448|nr:MAG: hypothetical protein KVP17_003830 [Porospora cf. gigantea B]